MGLPNAAALSPAIDHLSRKRPFRMRPWQQQAIELLAGGESIGATMNILGMSESVFFKTCNRHPEFRALVDLAREYAAATVEDRMHELGHLARITLHQVLLDKNTSPAVRLRAALAVLNRRLGAWLPGPVSLPAPLAEISQALDSSDSGVRGFGSPQATEKTAETPVCSGSGHRAAEFSKTGQVGGAQVIEFAAAPRRVGQQSSDASQSPARVGRHGDPV